YGDPQSGGGTTGRHRANDGRRRANEAFGGQVTLPAHSPGRSRPLSGSVRTGVRPDADYPCPPAWACRGGGAPAPAHPPRDASAGNSAAECCRGPRRRDLDATAAGEREARKQYICNAYARPKAPADPRLDGVDRDAGPRGVPAERRAGARGPVRGALL